MKHFAALFSVVLLGLPSSASACAVCFGAKGDKMTEVASWSILFLLGVIACVLAGIGTFIFHLSRLSRQ